MKTIFAVYDYFDMLIFKTESEEEAITLCNGGGGSEYHLFREGEKIPSMLYDDNRDYEGQQFYF